MYPLTAHLESNMYRPLHETFWHEQTAGGSCYDYEEGLENSIESATNISERHVDALICSPYMSSFGLSSLVKYFTQKRHYLGVMLDIERRLSDQFTYEIRPQDIVNIDFNLLKEVQEDRNFNGIPFTKKVKELFDFHDIGRSNILSDTRKVRLKIVRGETVVTVEEEIKTPYKDIDEELKKIGFQDKDLGELPLRFTDKNFSASENAKRLGFKTLLEVSEISGESTQTLNNWLKNKPYIFFAVLAKAKQFIR